MHNWYSILNYPHKLSQEECYWLTEIKKLGNELSKIYPKRVLINKNNRKIMLSSQEQCILNCNTAFQRIIVHKNLNEPLVYARTLISDQTYQKHKVFFDKLQNNSIGDSYLFDNPNYNRSDFEISAISRQYIKALFDYDSEADVLARRSIFSNHNHDKLLIEEYFVGIIKQ